MNKPAFRQFQSEFLIMESILTLNKYTTLEIREMKFSDNPERDQKVKDLVCDLIHWLTEIEWEKLMDQLEKNLSPKN